MDGDTDRLKYDEYRVYGYKKIGKLDVTADLIDVTYASAINDVKDSYSVALAAQYDITEAWKLGADVEYSHNPDFERDTRVFFKLLYHFGSKGGA
jgi:long-subunit fatty acid transport protein